jgi:hypothetical protein
MRRIVLIVAALLLLVVPVAAFAAAKVFNDPQGDGGILDIKTVQVRKTSDGMLRHLITTYGSWAPSDLVSAGSPPVSLCFDIWTKRVPGEDRPDYLLCAAPTSDGRRMRGTLATVPATGRPRRVVIAEVDRPDNQSLAIEIAPSQLGKPKQYLFVAETTSPKATCVAPVPCTDFAPARPGTVTFRP